MVIVHDDNTTRTLGMNIVFNPVESFGRNRTLLREYFRYFQRAVEFDKILSLRRFLRVIN